MYTFTIYKFKKGYYLPFWQVVEIHADNAEKATEKINKIVKLFSSQYENVLVEIKN